MKVFRKDIEKILLAYESEQWLLSKVFFKTDDPATITELTQLLQKLPKDPEYPLNEAELFQLCKILLAHNHDSGKTSKAITQLCTHLGESFNCLEALNQNGFYNWHYFGMVLNWEGFSELKECLRNKVFCETMDLLVRGNLMSKPILAWLPWVMTYEELGSLHYVLSALDKYKVLDKAFLPLFVRPNASKGYDYTVVYKRLIFSNGFSIAAVNSKIFSKLVQKIDPESMEMNFTRFNNVVSTYLQNQMKLSYAGDDQASADDIREFFSTLFKNGILTIERFNQILSTPAVIPYIDDFLSIQTRSFTKLGDRLTLLHNHFDAILSFIRRIVELGYNYYRNIWGCNLRFITFLEKLSDKEDIITKSIIFNQLRPLGNSFFSLLPPEVLELVATTSNVHSHEEALEIARPHTGNPSAVPAAEPTQTRYTK